jgi:hypothetical protein
MTTWEWFIISEIVIGILCLLVRWARGKRRQTQMDEIARRFAPPGSRCSNGD